MELPSVEYKNSTAWESFNKLQEQKQKEITKPENCFSMTNYCKPTDSYGWFINIKATLVSIKIIRKGPNWIVSYICKSIKFKNCENKQLLSRLESAKNRN